MRSLSLERENAGQKRLVERAWSEQSNVRGGQSRGRG